MAQALRIHDAPGERLHATQRASHHRRELLDAEHICQTCLCMHPVFHGDYREIGAIWLAGSGIIMHRAGRTETRSEIVDADNKKSIGIDRLAGPDHVVPPAKLFLAGLVVDIRAGDMM